MIVLGLGSNFGDRLGYLRKTVRALRSGAFRSLFWVLAVSPIYESDALLADGSPPGWNQPFLNLAVLAESRRGHPDPTGLLQELKKLERSLGRQERGRWAPREIDIDILLINSLVFHSEALEIPHPGLRERPFALLPTADLLPEWRFPFPDDSGNARELCADWRYGNPELVPFRARRSSLALPELVGILNITPDSFSNDGLLGSLDELLDRARSLVRAGASVLELGAESTRPGAEGVDPGEEWRRLSPVFQFLAEGLGSECPGVKISVDTRHAEVARRALEQGSLSVSLINDVTGGEDRALREVIANSRADLVFMHSLGLPPSRERILPHGRDPVDLLLRWADGRVLELERSGIPRERLIFDPGIGFGKSPEQSMVILSGARRFHELGVRILIGHSRKSFLRKWDTQPDRAATGRDHETSLISGHLAAAGVDYIRVHDVDGSRRALAIFALMDGVSRC